MCHLKRDDHLKWHTASNHFTAKRIDGKTQQSILLTYSYDEICLMKIKMTHSLFIPGWVPIMKIVEDSTFGFSSPYWTNNKLLNHGSSLYSEGNAKYAAFLSTPFKTIRMCTDSRGHNCISHSFSKIWKSAKDLFSAGYIHTPTLPQDKLLAMFGAKKGSYRVSNNKKQWTQLMINNIR